MSRVSIARRITRIREHHRPRGSIEGRVDRLSDEHKAIYQIWSERCARIISSYENHRDGFYYESLVAGTLRDQPELPPEIVEALFPEYQWGIIRGDDPVAGYDAMLHPKEGWHE